MSNVEATSEIFLRSSAPINPAAANCAGVLNVADFKSVVSSLVFTFHKLNRRFYCALRPKRCILSKCRNEDRTGMGGRRRPLVSCRDRAAQPPGGAARFGRSLACRRVRARIAACACRLPISSLQRQGGFHLHGGTQNSGPLFLH